MTACVVKIHTKYKKERKAAKGSKGKRMKKKYAILAMCIAVSGMGIVPVHADGIEDPEGLVDAYLKEERSNYNMEGTVSMGVKVASEGVTVEIPVDISLDMDVAGDNMHGEVGVKMEVAGQSMDENFEMYAEKDGSIMSTYLDLDGSWQCSLSNVSETPGFSSASEISEINWTGFEEKEDAYELTTDFSEIKDSLGTEADGIMDEFASSLGSGSSDILDSLGNGEVVYSFDKDTLDLLSVDMEGLEGKTETEISGSSVDLSFTLSMDIDFSDFGKVSEDDVKVPDAVKEEATGEHEGTDPSETETSETEASMGRSSFGAYNGTTLTSGPNVWSVFADDGWAWDMGDDEDGTYSFAAAKNEKYEGATLYVYNKDSSSARMADIEENGFYGYDLEYDGNDEIPFSFDGIKFGDPEETITEILGDPTDEYTVDAEYRTIYYEADDYSYSVRFTIENDRMTAVSVSFLN